MSETVEQEKHKVLNELLMEYQYLQEGDYHKIVNSTIKNTSYSTIDESGTTGSILVPSIKEMRSFFEKGVDDTDISNFIL